MNRVAERSGRGLAVCDFMDWCELVYVEQLRELAIIWITFTSPQFSRALQRMVSETAENFTNLLRIASNR